MNECVCLSECLALTKPRPLAEWHADMGPQLWWCLEEIKDGGYTHRRWLGEAPYVGSPLDLGFTVEAHTTLITQVDQETKPVIARINAGGWPGYHTHFTPLPPMPEVPK